jgi:hypothetical protein
MEVEGMKTTSIRMSNINEMRGFALLLALIALVLGSATAARAAPGDPDTGFDGDGKAATDFPNAFNDSGLDVAVQEDGKAVVAGVVFRSGSGHDFAVARYKADGSPDTAFGSGGQVITPVGPGASGDERPTASPFVPTARSWRPGSPATPGPTPTLRRCATTPTVASTSHSATTAR